jgi:hypothetical protein
MNISIDIHGVIDRDPDTFRAIAHRVRKEGGEVTIISGSLPDTLLLHLVEHNIPHDRWVSVTQFLLNRGHPWEYDEHHRPSFNIDTWNQGKGTVVRELNKLGGAIDIHIDDTAIYGETFPSETLFYYYTGDISYEILLKRLASRPSQRNQILESTI